VPPANIRRTLFAAQAKIPFHRDPKVIESIGKRADGTPREVIKLLLEEGSAYRLEVRGTRPPRAGTREGYGPGRRGQRSLERGGDPTSMGGGSGDGRLLTRAAVSLRFQPSSRVKGEVCKASIMMMKMPTEPTMNKADRTRLISVADAPRNTPNPAVKPIPKSAAKLV
jgi:hypothetical protein